MQHRSSDLKVYINNCPGAMWAEKDDPTPLEIGQAGVTAHAVLEYITKNHVVEETAKRKLANQVTEKLITEGRSFDGNPEPPLNPDEAIRGRDMALEWSLYYEPEPPKGHPEIGLGIDERGQSSPYDLAYYKVLIDLLYFDLIETEESQFSRVVVRDYKTDWQSDEGWFDTLQAKGAAVAAMRQYPEADTLRLELVNLRMKKRFFVDYLMDDAGLEMIDEWADDILMTCRSSEKNREFRPGAGCIDCRRLLKCDVALDLGLDFSPVDHLGELAARYAVIKGLDKQYGERLRKALKHSDPVPVHGGVVGYVLKTTTQLKENAEAIICNHWYAGTEIRSEDRALLKVLSLGSTSVKALAKFLYKTAGKNTVAHDEFLDAVSEQVGQSRFGVHKK